MSYQDISCLTNISPAINPITVTLPAGTTATSTHTACLNLPQLPLTARKVHLFPNFVGSLLSIGILCDHGMIATYTSTTVTITDKKDQIILTGTRSPTNNIWLIDISSHSSSLASTAPNIVHSPSPLRSGAVRTEAIGTHAQIVNYYHSSMGSPVVSTLYRALSQSYVSLPGLTPALLRKYAPNTVPSAKGHLDQYRHGLRSTKPNVADPTSNQSLDETDSDRYPVSTPRSSNRALVYTRTVNLNDIRHSDLTGRFPIPAKSGAQYILVMYCGNYIHAETLKSRKQADFVAAYSAGTDFFAAHGIIPSYERIDNETSNLLERYCANHQPPIQLQYVPPNDHRANKAERAIRTWKNHFIAMLCTCDPDFPFDAWDLLIPQAELTINLLRSSASCQHTSAWHDLHGPYNYDSEPIAPPGMKVLCFEDPDNRSSWAPHGVPGFYVGPAFKHHRCFSVYIPSTGATRITGQLSWHPPPLYTLPGASPTDDLISCLSNLRTSIDHICNTHPALLLLPQPVVREIPLLVTSLNSLAEIFRTCPPSNTPPSSAIPTFPIAPTTTDSIETLTTSTTPISPVLQYGNSHHIPPPSLAAPPSVPIVPSSLFDDGIAQRVSTNISFDQLTPTNVPRQLGHEDAQSQRVLDIPTPHRVRRSRRKRKPNPRWSANSTQNLLPVPITASVILSDAFALDKNNRPLTYKATRTSPDLDLWHEEEANELVRLIETSSTMDWFDFSLKPAHRTASYYNPQVKVKVAPDGTLNRRVRGTYGGNVTDYTGLRSSWTADMQTVKLLLNATVSENAHLCSLDLKDFYLGSTLADPEYMWLTRTQVPQAILHKYGNRIIWSGNKTMVRITKGLYGLPQAGRLAHEKLTSLLAKHGYKATSTPCLFKHITNGLYFTLVVDDFLIKYHDRESLEHLFSCIRKEYNFDVDEAATKYIGMTIAYDKPGRSITISMPGYVKAALKRFNVIIDSTPTHCPAKSDPIKYGQKIQYATSDLSDLVNEAQATFIREVIGVFLYYARAVDPTMLCTLSKLSLGQGIPTIATYNAILHFLQYAATYPDAVIRYNPSDMRLILWSDGSYLSEPKARSRAGGVHYLTSTGQPDEAPINGAIDILSTIIPTVVASATEAELASLFLNAQLGMASRATLSDLGYVQDATPIITDSTTAKGIADQSVRIKRSKAIDMRYFWIKDRVKQGHFSIHWGPGALNLADYFSKTHPIQVYLAKRASFLDCSGHQVVS